MEGLYHRQLEKSTSMQRCIIPIRITAKNRRVTRDWKLGTQMIWKISRKIPSKSRNRKIILSRYSFIIQTRWPRKRKRRKESSISRNFYWYGKWILRIERIYEKVSTYTKNSIEVIDISLWVLESWGKRNTYITKYIFRLRFCLCLNFFLFVLLVKTFKSELLHIDEGIQFIAERKSGTDDLSKVEYWVRTISLFMICLINKSVSDI